MLFVFYCCQVMHVNSILLIKPIVYLKMYKENTLFLQNTMRGRIKGWNIMFQQHLVVFILRFEPMCNPSEEVFLFKTHVKIQCLVRMSHWWASQMKPSLRYPKTVILLEFWVGASVSRSQSYKPKTGKCQNNAWRRVSRREWGRRRRSHLCSGMNRIWNYSCAEKQTNTSCINMTLIVCVCVMMTMKWLAVCSRTDRRHSSMREAMPWRLITLTTQMRLMPQMAGSGVVEQHQALWRSNINFSPSEPSGMGSSITLYPCEHAQSSVNVTE